MPEPRAVSPCWGGCNRFTPSTNTHAEGVPNGHYPHCYCIPRRQRRHHPDRARQAKLAERDEKIAEAQRRAADDRRDVDAVGRELVQLYANPDELLKHARVVGLDEIGDNEHNLNIPRYVDTFEPEARLPVAEALRVLADAEVEAQQAQSLLSNLLNKVGYEAH